LFRSGRTAEALSGLRDLYEMVIIDGPPLLTSAGSTALGQVVDGVVLMVEGGTPSTSIQDARRQLAFLTSETLGFVFVHED
jgi:Mrp family chromosome partitioning ATPase